MAFSLIQKTRGKFYNVIFLYFYYHITQIYIYLFSSPSLCIIYIYKRCDLEVESSDGLSRFDFSIGVETRDAAPFVFS